MYAILAFTYKAPQEHQEIVNKCLSFLGQEYKLLDIPSYKVEDHLKKDTIVLTFGKLAELQVQSVLSDKKVINVRHEKLPHPSQLIKVEDNKESRERTLNKLKEIKEFLAEDVYQPEVKTITKEDLPDLEHRQLLMLEKIVEESGNKYCIQTAKNGKIVEIGNTIREGSKADIQLTFQGIYTLRIVMDVLGVDEVQLVTADSTGAIIPDNKKIT